MPSTQMTWDETEQFLTCARVGRLGLSLREGPYIVPVGYVYSDGKIFFHTCEKGLKMQKIRKNPRVCFEVDETISDTSMYKSVTILGTIEIVEDKEKMIPYLQKLIDKYRIAQDFDEYMKKPGRDREKELNEVRICVIKPAEVTGRRFVR
jgi:nitroimidazol reductase NimA-like FMN-containing flavoprotein (pyridoxamine 5'-phosphate oxidase superfamily)